MSEVFAEIKERQKKVTEFAKELSDLFKKFNITNYNNSEIVGFCSSVFANAPINVPEKPVKRKRNTNKTNLELPKEGAKILKEAKEEYGVSYEAEFPASSNQ